MLLLHSCRRKYKAELLHEELDSCILDFIYCIIKDILKFHFGPFHLSYVHMVTLQRSWVIMLRDGSYFC